MDEQAGSTFVADRNGNLVTGGIRGGIERIQGHAQGRLVIAASPGQSLAHGGAVAALLERARRHANHAEVLGYV